jgi:hypothetical protein
MRQRLLRRTLRNAPVLAPFMIGAAVGAVMNRRDTRKLAERVRRDLRATQFPWPEIPVAEAGPGPYPAPGAGTDDPGTDDSGPAEGTPGDGTPGS